MLRIRGTSPFEAISYDGDCLAWSLDEYFSQQDHSQHAMDVIPAMSTLEVAFDIQ